MASSALGLVQVSEPDKNFLFEEAIKDSGHCIKRSQRALAQLNSFQPLLSRDFAIREFGGAKAPFRLLFDLPVLNQHPFGNTTRSFIALSYCWHDGTWEPHQGLGRHQKPWPIAPSMLSALRAERLSLEEGIWIDQLCIDQECESEKRHAIGEMDLIYKSARVVVAVLEDIIVSSSEEVILHGLLNDKSRDTQDLFDDLNKHAKEQATLVLFRILSARWFRRAWCSHELQVSTALIFILPTPKGTYRMTTQSLEDFYSATVDFRTESGLEDKYYNVESYDFLTRSFYDEADRGEKSLLCQFSDNMKLGSTIESDKISISMNIVGLQLIYFCPRRTEDQCKWILAMLALSSGEALALCGIEEALTIDNPHAQYPAESWLRWYDEIEDPMSPFGGSRLEQPSYIAAIDERYINLELFCIQKLSFLIPTVDSLQRAGGFVNEFLSLCKVKHEFSLMSVDSIAGNGIVTHEPLIQILSCSIECGRRWMVKQMASVKEVAEQMRTKLKKLKFDLWPIVHKMLECTAIYQSTDREGSLASINR
ncbi:uncharacterized protein KY384_001672 [Bacidia gigantensis]|uniref:uncharacterized protein n=1 Tax=Bacidia gigantensis TaxID=2732470 RepID=UPI001D03668B|nr:uncharacterized protein KY384_001672 [Bacidia gigantensis]KAG8533931.1 hypothetical protein KY384_001672 [Bacidia gigantensis]